MSTARDLLTVALDAESGGDGGSSVPRGDLSLALAGAELLDLLDAEAARLEGEFVLPGHRPSLADRMLDEAASSLAEQPAAYEHAPHETVEDWLWRRGRGLAAAYLIHFWTEGLLLRRRPRWMPFRTGPLQPADTPDRRLAADRLAAHEPVLTGLAAAVGLGDSRAEETPGVTDAVTETVLAAVHDAVQELEAVRQRRAIEQSAFDNIWRGDGM